MSALVSVEDHAANGTVGVCRRCVDLVPVVTDRGQRRCGNAADHARGQGVGGKWTPTKRHVLAALGDPHAAFCRHCRRSVPVNPDAGRPRCPQRAHSNLSTPARGSYDTEGPSPDADPRQEPSHARDAP